ncbi:MAG TPA: hypothetical protein DCM65_05695 [Acinetobacter junii]|nr:hypothetical protein [Acinetobacter junii]
MRKITILTLLLILPILTNAKDKYDPECKISSFDSSKTCFIRPYGAWVEDKKSVLGFVSFGGTWVSSTPNNIGLTIFYGDGIVNIDAISFNIDGDISTFKTELMSNKSSTEGRLSNTTALAIIPLDYLEKIVNGRDVKYRLTTLSDGYREGSLIGPKGESSAFKGLKGLFKSIQFK